MSDSLDRFTDALRHEGRLEPERAERVRRRVLGAPKRRVVIARWLLPVAAVLAGVTAWAGIREHWRQSEPAVEAPPVVMPKRLEPSIVTPRVEAPPVVTVTASTPRATPSPTHHADAPTVAPASSSDDARAALRAYREAEHAQFDDKDYARALDAWDRYLAQAGTSPLGVDARYDRALCLMHLGRRDEARAALGPFADAPPGCYRQADAKALLDTLR